MNGGCSLLYPKQFQMSCGFSFGQLVQALDHHSHGRLPLLNSTSMPHPTQIIATLHLPPKLLFFIYCITYGDSMRLLLHIWLAFKLLHFLHSNILYRLFILSHWPIMTLFWEEKPGLGLIPLWESSYNERKVKLFLFLNISQSLFLVLKKIIMFLVLRIITKFILIQKLRKGG